MDNDGHIVQYIDDIYRNEIIFYFFDVYITYIHYVFLYDDEIIYINFFIIFKDFELMSNNLLKLSQKVQIE
jgi:hypothetical protein